VPQQDSGRPRRAGPDHEQNRSKHQEESALEASGTPHAWASL
jgi:hypothetical protein